MTLKYLSWLYWSRQGGWQAVRRGRQIRCPRSQPNARHPQEMTSAYEKLILLPIKVHLSSFLFIPCFKNCSDTFCSLPDYTETFPSSFWTPKETDFHLSSKAYLDGIVAIDDDEGLLNISSILSTVTILFLVSLFYSATVTVIKVKLIEYERKDFENM